LADLIILYPDFLAEIIACPVDHKGNEQVGQVDIHLQVDGIRVVPIVLETKAVIDEQEFIRAIAVTVVGLFARLETPPLNIDHTKVRLLV
jgi:hypothetical protein